MPRWVSHDGVTHPAKEKVALVNNTNKTIINPSAEYSEYHGKEVAPGDPFIYEGPDRAALFELWKIDNSGSVTTLGQDFHDDVELQDMVRQRGYKSVAEYAKSRGYDKEKSKERFEKEASIVTKHELPKKVQMIETAHSGGDDTSGLGKDMKGGFGQEPTESARF